MARAKRCDVLVVGGGHNGLISAVLLARSKLSVTVLEQSDVIGGAVRSEYPFPKAPGLRTSTGAYLLGLMPPELTALLGLELPLLRRDPHYFLPTTEGRYLLIGSDRRALQDQFERFFSHRDWQAQLRLEQELAALREDVAQTWFRPPLSIEETAERYVRPALRQRFVALCRGSVGDYLNSFGFDSDLLQAMYAVTDGFSGLSGGFRSPGSGMNFLIHNMCRLPGSDGTWMLVRGGMGTVTERLAQLAARENVELVMSARVAQIECEAGRVCGVTLDDGREWRASSVIVNADPFTLRDLVGAELWPADYTRRLAALERPGKTLKLNLALSGLPRFTCLPEDVGQFGTTIHLLPPEATVLSDLQRSLDDAEQGRLPEFPSIEWYIHGAVDHAVRDDQGRLSSAFFVQWVPYTLADSDWERESPRYAEHLLSIADRFAPGTSDLVVDYQMLHPPAIERRFGIRHGHIHHVDNSFGFADRPEHRTPIPGLYSCSAGTHPAGSVIGCAGYLAAQACAEDLGVPHAERQLVPGL